jgi:hypothetical protein
MSMLPFLAALRSALGAFSSDASCANNSATICLSPFIQANSSGLLLVWVPSSTSAPFDNRCAAIFRAAVSPSGYSGPVSVALTRCLCTFQSFLRVKWPREG